MLERLVKQKYPQKTPRTLKKFLTLTIYSVSKDENIEFLSFRLYQIYIWVHKKCFIDYLI